DPRPDVPDVHGPILLAACCASDEPPVGTESGVRDVRAREERAGRVLVPQVVERGAPCSADEHEGIVGTEADDANGTATGKAEHSAQPQGEDAVAERVLDAHARWDLRHAVRADRGK